MHGRKRACRVALVGKESPASAGDWEAQVRSLGREDPWRRAWQPTLVFLPGESPWTEEPGGLPSMGSERVRQDWSDWAHIPAPPSGKMPPKCGVGAWGVWAGSLTTPLPPRFTPRPAEVLGRGSDGSGSSCDLQPGAQQAGQHGTAGSCTQIFSNGKQPWEGDWQRWGGWYNSVSEGFLS